MPVTKNKRRNGTVATRRAPMWLASREYKALCAKVYLLEQQLETVRAFLSGMIQSMQARPEAAPPPADTGTPGVEPLPDAAVYDGQPMPVTVARELVDGV